MTNEELKICALLKAFIDGNTIRVRSFTFNMYERKIIGGCGDGCCDWEFNSLDEFLNKFNLNDIEIL